MGSFLRSLRKISNSDSKRRIPLFQAVESVGRANDAVFSTAFPARPGAEARGRRAQAAAGARSPPETSSRPSAASAQSAAPMPSAQSPEAAITAPPSAEPPAAPR